MLRYCSALEHKLLGNCYKCSISRPILTRGAIRKRLLISLKTFIYFFSSIKLSKFQCKKFQSFLPTPSIPSIIPSYKLTEILHTEKISATRQVESDETIPSSKSITPTIVEHSGYEPKHYT